MNQSLLYASFVGVAGLYALTAQQAVARAMTGLKPPPYRLRPRARVSIVVPTLMESQYLPTLLISLANQTEPVYEVIVVDSSPTEDPTASVARSYGAHCVSYPKGNLAAARNYGASLTSGEVLLFSDADVVLSSFFVEKAVSALLSGSFCVHPREAIYDSGFWNLMSWGPQIFRGRVYTSRCAMVWRAVFDEINGYDESCNPLEGCREDVTLGKRVAARYGTRRIRTMPAEIATSARRMKRFNLTGFENWQVPVRAHKPQKMSSSRTKSLAQSRFPFPP